VTLRSRVFGYLALAAGVSCLITVAVAVVLVRHRVVVQRRAALAVQAELTASNDLAPGTRVYALNGGHPRLIAFPVRRQLVLNAIPAASTGQGTFTAAGRSWMYAIRPSAFGRAVLIRSATIAFAEWRPFLTSIAIAGAGGIVLAALLAFALARRLTRPVGALVRATHDLADGVEGVAVPAQGEDELADLGRSFNRMSAELARARAAQRRFLESVSHELRTPLTSIRGYAEAIDEGAVGPAEGAAVIAAEAGRLERLVADLLELARVGREGFAVRADRLDLGALAAQAVGRHQPAAAAAGVQLRCRADGPAPAVGDSDRVLQVVSNLLENALRLTPAGGLVEVRSAPGRLAVRDGGPGLAAEDLPRAFERFYLHDRYRGERPVGSGLGLAIVAELVQAMGGEVRALSPPGGGAEFVVTLPGG
jgi:two-component system OmpR family sensor kinase